MVRVGPRAYARGYVLARKWIEEVHDTPDLDLVASYIRGAAQVAYLEHVLVPKKARRQGLGSRLVGRFLQAALAEGARKALLVLDLGREQELLPFYRRLGWRVIAKVPPHGETFMGRGLRKPTKRG